MTRGAPAAAEAVAAAVAVAERHGLRVGRPVVLNEHSNFVIELAPYPLVARLPATTALVRGHAWPAREVAVASALAAAGAPVGRPSDLLPAGEARVRPAVGRLRGA